MNDVPEIGGRRPLPINVVAGESYWWCACGRSKSQPFCDGSHKGHRIPAAGMEGGGERGGVVLRLQALAASAAVRRQS